MEPEKMVIWQTFVAFFTAGNQLKLKNGKNCGFRSWNIGNTSGDGIAMVTETYGCIQTDTQWDSMDAKSMGIIDNLCHLQLDSME